MYEVRASPGKNRLYFTMAGVVSADDARAAAERVEEEMKRLRPGFDTVSNIAGLEPLPPEALEQIRRINRYLVGFQRGRILRVVGRSAKTAVQFERLSKAHGYSAQLAFSLQEAERLLDAKIE